ncbi:protein translocase subunit SecD [Actinomyces vulturis]|uniref:protein translocase subunit SecD n=1 Tax=Actinomyces vulturis TaxID=1857645 RepID=UPI000835EA8C|nr:protein translocase subunit SecD [Actinomyces vulturis]
MSTYKTKHAGRTLIVLFVLVALATAALVTGAATHRASLTPGLALDLEGGTQLILTPTTTDGSQITDADIDQAIDIIRQRVDASGVAEAEINRQGGQNIVVSLPGKPSQETLDLVRSSAVLYFRPVIRAYSSSATAIAQAENAQIQQAGQPVSSAAPSDEASVSAPVQPDAEQTAAETEAVSPAPEATALPTVTAQEVANQIADVNHDGTISDEPLPSTSDDNSSDSWISEKMIFDALMMDCKAPENLKGGAQDPDKAVISCSKDGDGVVFILGPADLKGTDITNATSGLQMTSQGQATNTWVVNLTLDKQGTEIFANVSQRLMQYRNSPTDPQKNRFAIVLDGLTVSAPGIQSPITDGHAEISGSFTQASAATLANQLSFGSLPLNFTVQSEQQISATLGSEQLTYGLISGLIGFALIVLYLLWQYRGLSVVAVASLFMAALITYLTITILSWTMGYRLSLAGVAGLIISIGITMDSFVIYFERVRDEVRHGRTLTVAVDEGWVHARRTIIVSDAVNILAAVVLYILAVGGVQGFAFTLGVTTVVDLIIIIMFTHPMMVSILKLPFFGQGHRLSGLDPEHLGASSSAVYAAGRQRVADNVTMSLARKKALAREQAKKTQSTSSEQDGDNA